MTAMMKMTMTISMTMRKTIWFQSCIVFLGDWAGSWLSSGNQIKSNRGFEFAFRLIENLFFYSKWREISILVFLRHATARINQLAGLCLTKHQLLNPLFYVVFTRELFFCILVAPINFPRLNVKMLHWLGSFHFEKQDLRNWIWISNQNQNQNQNTIFPLSNLGF